MSVDRLLLTLRARRRLLLAVFLGALAILLPLSLSVPAQYRASASVLVERFGADPIDGQPLPPGVLSNYVATQADIMRSTQVALRAVRRLGMPEDAAWRERWQAATEGRGELDAWLAEAVQKKVRVTPSRDSNVLNVSYRSDDAAFAAAIVNALVQAYADTTLDMRVEPARAYNAFFDQRAEPLRAALEKARARLSAYQKQHGLMTTDEGGDVESRRLAELNSQVVEVEGAVAAARARRLQARSSPRNTEEALRDPVVASLTAELARKEAQLGEMRSHLGPNHPEVRDAVAGLGDLRRTAGAAVQRAASSTDLSLKVTESRLRELRTAVEQQRARVTQQAAQRDEASVLGREVDSAQAAYEAVLARASQTALESRTPQSNVIRLGEATPPPAALWPKWLPALAAVLVALFLGMLAALAREARDRRLRTFADVRITHARPLVLALSDGSKVRNALGSEQTAARLVTATPRLTFF